MTLSQITKRTQRLLSDNSPALLTAVGVTGVVTTAVLTGKASFRAADILRDAEYRSAGGEPDYIKQQDLTPRQKIELTYKLYIPAFGMGVVSVGAIIGANRVGARRAAVAASALTLSEKAYVEYKDKVLEKIGENKEREVRDEIAQDRVTRDYSEVTNEIAIGEGNVLCHDAHSGRFFSSNRNTIDRAVNDLNRQIVNGDDSVTIDDFYDLIGLAHVATSGEFGFNAANPLDLEWTSTLAPDDRPALSFTFKTRPVFRPWQFA